jgi:hypothetical protein
MRRRLIWLTCLSAALSSLVPGVQAGPSPRDQLLALVPQELGLCLLVTDLREQSQKLAQTPWVEHFWTLPLGRQLAAAPEWAQLRQVEGVLQQVFQVDLRQLRDDILGDAFLLAYRPAVPSRGLPEQGLFLLWARQPQLLARLMERLDAEQLRHGELRQREARSYRGTTYICRIKDKKEQYYWIEGALLAFTEQEALLQEVIARRQRGVRAASPLSRALAESPTALVYLWLDGQLVRAVLQDREATAAAAAAQALRTCRRYWEALDGALLSLTLLPEPELRLSVLGRQAALPPAGQRLVQAAQQPAEVWRLLPADALVRLAGRLDVAALEQVLEEFLLPETRRRWREGWQRQLGAILGADLFQEVLPRLGPDWGLCLLPPTQKGNFPELLFALRLQDGPPQAPVDQALCRGLQFFAQVVIWHHNQTHPHPLRLRELRQGAVTVYSLSGPEAFPPGWQPSFAFKAGYLVLASSPAAVARFAATSAAPPQTEGLLCQVAVTPLRRMLQEQLPTWSAFLGAHQPGGPQAAERALTQLLSALEWLEEITLTQEHLPGRFTWRLHLRPAAHAPAGDRPAP